MTVSRLLALLALILALLVAFTGPPNILAVALIVLCVAVVAE